MIGRLRETCTPYLFDLITDSIADDDPPQKKWHLISENYGAARRALFAARMQLL